MDIGRNQGALLLGGFIAAGLSGIILVQTLIYFKFYPSDPPVTKALFLLTTGRLCCASVSSAEMIRLRTLSAFKSDIGWLFTLGLALSSVVDILVTLCLFILLQRNRTNSLSLDHILDALILYTFEVGSLTWLARAPDDAFLLQNQTTFARHSLSITRREDSTAPGAVLNEGTATEGAMDTYLRHKAQSTTLFITMTYLSSLSTKILRSVHDLTKTYTVVTVIRRGQRAVGGLGSRE
ncbi:hypothetical protein C0995_005250 [Termitomyces sp. Mi166|nr:hypothetical protein C0995_005250 [Termitomyces sp. Mi166\